MINVLYELDMTHVQYDNDDLETMFLSSLYSLCSNSSEKLNIKITVKGWPEWLYSAVRLTAGEFGHSVAFVEQWDPFYSSVRKRVEGIYTYTWTNLILDRLAVKDFFQGEKYAWLVDADIVFDDDIAKYMPDDDKALYCVPDGFIYYVKDTKQRTDIPRVCAGIVCCNLDKFPSFDGFMSYYDANRDRIEGAAEQDIISNYFFDNGMELGAFPSEKVTNYAHTKWFDEEIFKKSYAMFGVDDPKKPDEKTIRIDHLSLAEALTRDPSSRGYRFWSKYKGYADTLVDGLSLQKPSIPSPRAFSHSPKEGPRTRSPFASHGFRTIVFSNSGLERWYDYVLPCALSVCRYMTSDARFVVLEGNDRVSGQERQLFREVVTRYNKKNSVDFRAVDPDTEILADSKWTKVHLHKLFASDILSDIDDYCLFMDTDIMAVDDLEPLFRVCDVQPDDDRVVGEYSWFHFKGAHEAPVKIAGGFFFMHPSGSVSKAAKQGLFTEFWHDNDEFVLSKETVNSRFVNLGNPMLELATEGVRNGRDRMVGLEEHGSSTDRPFCVHFFASSGRDRFNPLMFKKKHRHYVDEWNFCKDAVKLILANRK